MRPLRRGAPPRHRLARIERIAAAGFPLPLAGVAPLAPFVLADGRSLATQQTEVRVAHDGATLFVRFDCADRDVWGTYERRDDPLWNEEVVELFLSPGHDDPVRYHEFEVSPLGVLFDAVVHNPGGPRENRTVDAGWDCPGIAWRAQLDPDGLGWRAELSIPWAAVGPPGALPGVWRANFYRIERPRDGEAEYSCWSTTRSDPADFHRPARFGFLEA